MRTACLLTGMPGTGKTSLIKQAISAIGDRAGGFYTEEIRLQGIRRGFRIVTLDGQTASLAHTDMRGPYRISKYGVNVEGLDAVGVTALRQAAESCDVVVIDEIGKMELFSDKFKAAVLEIIDSGKTILRTIMLKSDPWADRIKERPQVHLITLTRNNRQEVLKQVEDFLKKKL